MGGINPNRSLDRSNVLFLTKVKLFGYLAHFCQRIAPRLLQVEKQYARHEWTIYPKSNDRFGIKGLVSPDEGAKLGRLYDGKSGLVVLAEDESGPIPS